MDMIKVTDRLGSMHIVPMETDRSLMEAIRDAGIEELAALCGGCLSCATCHVIIDPNCMAELPAMSADEDDLLDGSLHRTATSRLACQIPLSPELGGLAVTIAPEE
jgi:ferredoxin